MYDLKANQDTDKYANETQTKNDEFTCYYLTE